MQKEKYQLPLTKTEAKHLYKTLAIVENTKEKLPKGFWEKHDVLIEKLEVIIYNSKKVYNNSKGGDTK